MAKKWEIEEAVSTLIRAQKILKDKKLLPAVKREFKRQQDALAETALELKVAKKQRDMRKK